MSLLRTISALLLAASVVFSFSVQADESKYDWQLEKENKDYKLKIYTRNIKGSPLKEFRAEMQVNAGLGSVMTVLSDFEHNCEWLANCKEYKMIEQVSKQSNLSYFVQSAPWPVSNRDGIVLTETTQEPKTLVINIALSAEPKRLPKTDNVRIPSLKGKWVITPVDENTTDLIYQVHAEPGGSLPSWLANAVVIDTPYDTLRNFTKQLKKERYLNKKHPHYENFTAQVDNAEMADKADSVEAVVEKSAEAMTEAPAEEMTEEK